MEQLDLQGVHFVNCQSPDPGIIGIRMDLILHVLDGEDETGKNETVTVHIGNKKRLARILYTIKIDKHCDKDGGRAIDVLDETAYVKV